MKILPFLPPTQLCDVSAATLCWSISDKLILRHILHKTGGLWTFVLSDFWTRTSDWLCARKVTSCGCTDWQRHIACVFSIFVFSNFLIFAFFVFCQFLYFANFRIFAFFVFCLLLYTTSVFLYLICIFNCASLEFYSFICVIVSFLTTVLRCVWKVTSCSRTDRARPISSCCPKMSNLWTRMQQSRFW